MNADTLLSKKLLLVGTLSCHSVYVSSDNLRKQDSLRYVGGSPNGLVVSYFLNTSSSPPGILEGDIGRALKEKLSTISPDTNELLNQKLKALRNSAVKGIATLDLHLSKEGYATFPINRIYLVLLNDARDSNKDALAEVVPNVMTRAAEDGMSSLVIPCFGYDWKKNKASFGELFEPLVKAVGTGQSPAHIYIALYEDWEWNIVVRAITSVSDQWQYYVAQATQNELFGLFHSDYRSIVIFLCLCLFVSSFCAWLTVQNGLIISLAYLGAALGIIKTTDFFTQGYGPTFSLMFKAAARFGLALMFPFIVNWNPRNVFTSSGDDDE